MNSNKLYRIVLVYWLFGSWGFFKESCKWIDTFNYQGMDSLTSSINGLAESQNVSDKARKVCLDYMNISKNPTRNAFIKSHYREFNWLLKYDREWLDQMLPVIKGWKQILIFD